MNLRKLIDYKKINYKNLISFIYLLILFNILIIVFFDVLNYNLILINLVIFLFFNEFIYNELYQVNITIRNDNYNFIINDDEVFFEFKFLYKMYDKQID